MNGIRVEVGVVANAPGEKVWSVWWMGDGMVKWRYCWWSIGSMWTEVWKPDLSTNMSISRKGRWSK